MTRRLVACMLLAVLIMTATPASTSADASPPGLRLLDELQNVITDLAERVKPSVVTVLPAQNTKSMSLRDRAPSTPGSGSGVIVDAQGHIITNNHVVGDAHEVEVRLSDRTKFIAQVVGKDPDTDLAVLKI